MSSVSSENIAYSVKHSFQKPFLLQDFPILIVSLFKMQNLRRVGLDGVENIDEDEKYCNEESHPARDHLGRIGINFLSLSKISPQYYLRVYKEWNPTDNDEESAWEVVGDNVERHFPRQHQLEEKCTIRKEIHWSRNRSWNNVWSAILRWLLLVICDNIFVDIIRKAFLISETKGGMRWPR